jgi:hypothetical protein
MNLSVIPRLFNSYGSRRGNDAVMARGTFANIRLVNKLAGKTGPQTLHIPSGAYPIKHFLSLARAQCYETFYGCNLRIIFLANIRLGWKCLPGANIIAISSKCYNIGPRMLFVTFCQYQFF